jgi:hypothetical protein
MSKISFQTKADADILGLIGTCGLDSVKAIDAPDLLRNLKGNVRIRIHRSTVGETACGPLDWDTGKNKMVGTPEQVVARFASIVAPMILADPTAYFEWMWNEHSVEVATGNRTAMMQWLGDCALAYMKWIDSLGVGAKAVIFTFSAMANIYDKCEPLRAAYEYAYEHGHIYGPHGYSSPHIMSSRDFVLPHEKVRTALGFLPYTIYTEGVVDSINGNSYNGWRTCLSLDDYYSEMLAYSKIVDQDSDVVAVELFIWTGQSGWTMYNYQKGGQDKEMPGTKFLSFFKADLINNPKIKILPRTLPGGTPPTPTPEPQPEPTPTPAQQLVFDLMSHMKGFNFTYFPGDTYGDRKVPIDDLGKPVMRYGNNEAQDKISHVEFYPPRETGVAAPEALRVQNQAPKVSFWFIIPIDTNPGDAIDVSMTSNAVFDPPQTAGVINRDIVIDPNGGEDATDKSLPSAHSEAHGYEAVSMHFVATGPKTVVMVKTACKVPQRINVDYTELSIWVTPAGTPTPTKPSPWVTTAWDLNLRLTPGVDSSNLILLLPAASQAELTGNSKNGYAEVYVYVSVKQGGTPWKIKGWLYDQGGLIRSNS